jgi:hypothetical protein
MYKYKGLEEIIKQQSKQIPLILEKELQNMKDLGFSSIIGEKILKYTEKSCSKMS